MATEMTVIPLPKVARVQLARLLRLNQRTGELGILSIIRGF